MQISLFFGYCIVSIVKIELSNHKSESFWPSMATILIITSNIEGLLQPTSNSPIGGWCLAVTAIIWLINEWVRVLPQTDCVNLGTHLVTSSFFPASFNSKFILSCPFKFCPSPLFWGKSLTLTYPCATRWLLAPNNPATSEIRFWHRNSHFSCKRPTKC